MWPLYPSVWATPSGATHLQTMAQRSTRASARASQGLEVSGAAPTRRLRTSKAEPTQVFNRRSCEKRPFLACGRRSRRERHGGHEGADGKVRVEETRTEGRRHGVGQKPRFGKDSLRLRRDDAACHGIFPSWCPNGLRRAYMRSRACRPPLGRPPAAPSPAATPTAFVPADPLASPLGNSGGAPHPCSGRCRACACAPRRPSAGRPRQRPPPAGKLPSRKHLAGLPSPGSRKSLKDM